MDDPNEALNELRGWAENALDADVDPQEREAAEHFQALDDWISRGSVLPDDWQPRVINQLANEAANEAAQRYALAKHRREEEE